MELVQRNLVGLLIIIAIVGATVGYIWTSSTYQSQMSSIEEDALTLSLAINELEKEFNVSETEISILKAQMAEKDEEIQGLQRQVTELQTKNNELESMYNELKARAGGIPMLKVSGSNIVDLNGQTVKLKGIQLAPVATLNQKQLDQIASWGMNVISIQTYWTGTWNTATEPKENEPQVYNEEGMQGMLGVIRRADIAGLYVIVQIRVCNDPDQTASGDYPWYGWVSHDHLVYNRVDSAGQKAFERFDKYLEWIIKGLIMNEPNVIGIEPYHFPYHKQIGALNDADRLSRYFSDLVPTMITSVRKHTDKIIFLNPPVLGWFDYASHPGTYSDPNIVYATGGYGVHDVVSSPNHEPWDYGPITSPHPSWKTFKAIYDVPVMSMEGPGIQQHAWPNEEAIQQDRWDLFEDTLKIVDEMDGWIIHMYSGERGWGVLVNNGTGPSSEGKLVDIIKRYTSDGP